MQSNSYRAALAFAGTFTGALALALALLAAEPAQALAALMGAGYCAAELLAQLDFAAPPEA